MSGTVTLSAESLAYKSGFGDGDMLDDLLYDWGLVSSSGPIEYGPDGHTFEHTVLIAIVQRLLLPHAAAQLGRELEASTIITIHNPIRLEGYDSANDALLAELRSVSLAVPESEIRAIADQCRASFVVAKTFGDGD